MKYKFLVSSALHHQKIHFKFIKSILKGDYVFSDIKHTAKRFPKEILRHDGPDVVWFFSELYYDLHSRLKGKQILTMHGLSFKPWFHKRRVDAVNNYLDLLFQPGIINERDCIKSGVIKEKIKKIGYTLLFEIPNLPTRKNSILFSFAIRQPWHYLNSFIEILRNLSNEIDGYLTIHPQINELVQDVLIEICRQKTNLTLIKTQQELLKAYAYCQYYAGGVSSVADPFWYLQKPVIFITDYKKTGFNKYKMAKRTTYPKLFHGILKESSILYSGMKLDFKFLKNAKISPSAKKIFYPSNFDRALTVSLIKDAVKQIA